MTFVSSASTTNGTYTSPSLSVGNLVVLVVHSGFSVSTPIGWEAAGSEVVTPAVDFYGRYGSVRTRIFWRRATSAGTLTANFTAWDFYLRIHSIVLDGPNGLVAILQKRINSAQFVFPAITLDDLYTGHILHVATVPAPGGSTATAGSGGTIRQSDKVFGPTSGVVGGQSSAWATLTEQSFTTEDEIPSDDSGDRVGGWAQTLVFANISGPDAPQILHPLAGTLDLAAGFTIEWEPSGEQTGYAVRRRLGAGAWYWWNGTDWTTATTETIITSTSTTLAVAPGAFANASSVYDIEVATVGDATRPELGEYATVTVTGKAPPTLSSAVVTPLSGSDITSLTPTVTLSGSAGSGGSFTGYRVRIDQDAGDGWVERLDSGVVSSPWTVSVAQSASLTNGLPTRFRSVAVQEDTQEGATTTSSTYTMAHPTPEQPVLAIEEGNHPESGLPGFEITVTSGTTGLLRLYRDGVLVYESSIVEDSPLVVTDWTVGSGEITYTGAITTGDGISTVIVTGPSDSVTSSLDPSGHCWLFDPLDPSIAVQAHCVTIDEIIAQPTSVYRPLGTDWPTSAVVRSLPPHTPAGTLTIGTQTTEELEIAKNLLTFGRPLMYRRWLHKTINGCDLYDLQPALYFWPVGDVVPTRLAQGAWQDREITVSWVTA